MTWAFLQSDYASRLSRTGATRLGERREKWLGGLSEQDRAVLDHIERITAQAPTLTTGFHEGVVTLSSPSSSPAEEKWREDLAEALRSLMPWKKGPFRVLGTDIDGEWRSDLKWDRIKDHTPLAGKVVADIGSHNGYFMFAAAPLRPAMMVGLEPAFRPFAQFNLLQHIGRFAHIHTEPIGVEDIDGIYPEFFDTILCMGVLYHQTDPIVTLRKLHGALRRGGEVIIDCQGIPGDDPLVLAPAGRYCGASGVWWLPTTTSLLNWVRRGGFRDAEVFFSEPLTAAEQRSTPWAPIRSLPDFLSPEDPTKTIEGYPAPWRHYVRARR